MLNDQLKYRKLMTEWGQPFRCSHTKNCYVLIRIWNKKYETKQFHSEFWFHDISKNSSDRPSLFLSDSKCALFHTLHTISSATIKWTTNEYPFHVRCQQCECAQWKFSLIVIRCGKSSIFGCMSWQTDGTRCDKMTKWQCLCLLLSTNIWAKIIEQKLPLSRCWPIKYACKSHRVGTTHRLRYTSRFSHYILWLHFSRGLFVRQ